MLFEGTLSICNLQNTAEAGEMPCEKLVVVDTVYYGERTVGPEMGVKASGGIRTREAAEAMIAAGATRIGASSSKAILGE